MKNESSNRIPLFPLFEKLFGISQIDSKEDLDKLIAELRKNPNQEIPIKKYAEIYETFLERTKSNRTSRKGSKKRE